MSQDFQLLYEESYNQKKHFSFGKNWQRFLSFLNDEKRDEAKKSLINFLGEDFKFSEKMVIDIGSGSGLFSWSLYDLGSRSIDSIDIDDFSLACTEELKNQAHAPENWNIHKISALDEQNIQKLGKFDLVYSWGVLHHTGDMWRAIKNCIPLVATKGYFYIALYNKNDKVWLEGTSKFWVKEKEFYNRQNAFIKKILDFLYATYYCIGLIVNRINPWVYIKKYKSARGMDFMTDVRDWLGGHPYEYASIEEVDNFFKKNGFTLIKCKGVRSIGCNEFLFVKN